MKLAAVLIMIIYAILFASMAVQEVAALGRRTRQFEKGVMIGYILALQNQG